MWEYPAFVFVLFVTYLLARNKVKNTLAKQPEMQYFMPGLFAKIIGGFMFACIYVFYYQQGDTTSFYECSLAFCKLFQTDFNAFITVLLGDGTQEMKSYFTSETGEPMMYMFGESSTRFVIKILIPFLLLAGHSYFIATAFISIFTFGALWSLYRVFLFYFPQQYRILAWAILFMPSVVFWGSGILKDSFTLLFYCFYASHCQPHWWQNDQRDTIACGCLFHLEYQSLHSIDTHPEFVGLAAVSSHQRHPKSNHSNSDDT
jgi:hypothetical protein